MSDVTWVTIELSADEELLVVPCSQCCHAVTLIMKGNKKVSLHLVCSNLIILEIEH